MLNGLFSFSGRISRKAYVLIALAGVLTKHIIDLSLAALVFHHEWTPLNYIVPLGIPTPLHGLGEHERTFILGMLTASLPFAWVGLAITIKRFRTIGWPSWTVVLFFVPIANIVSFAIAAAWPDAASDHPEVGPGWVKRLVPHDRLGAAVLSVVVTTALGVACVGFGTTILVSYGWGLFAAIPFAQGALAALLLGVHQRRTVRESIGVAMLTIFLTALALLAVALEGAICIAMAVPIAAVFSALGALFGHVIQDRPRGGEAGVASMLVCILVAPIMMGAETMVAREAPLYEVRTSVIIDAPPITVWNNVIRFPDLPAPTELPFRLGIAYPERAKIVGAGVGAVRYCQFSTGDFVEPITTWEPGHKLAFSVTHNAPPMRELTPYRGLDTAHLHNYMVSRHGEFLLEALPGARTKLTGTTWYQHHLWPASYWAMFSDSIVHRIHLRVLNHVKTLSEKRRPAILR